MALPQEDNVFINCPFDDDYKPIFNALIFAVHDAGFIARCALEAQDATENRLTKILQIVAECKYGIHDISRTELDRTHGLPRFNMPFEFGIFLGCKWFGSRAHREKTCLVLDVDRYRYQRFLSDIAGQDIMEHGQQPDAAVRRVRDWLRTESGRVNIPGGDAVVARYKRFQEQLPELCVEAKVQPHELTFGDSTYLITTWLKKVPHDLYPGPTSVEKSHP